MKKTMAVSSSGSKYSMFTQDSVMLLNRLALFIVFFWFGILKIFSLSPAESLITKLYLKTISNLISLQHFLILLGMLECFIGILFLFPRYTRLAFILFSLQIFTTFLPLIYLPNEVWLSGAVLTLTGQYIVKNVVLIACAITTWQLWQSQKL